MERKDVSPVVWSAYCLEFPGHYAGMGMHTEPRGLQKLRHQSRKSRWARICKMLNNISHWRTAS